jgi:hypothetical protein
VKFVDLFGRANVLCIVWKPIGSLLQGYSRIEIHATYMTPKTQARELLELLEHTEETDSNLLQLRDASIISVIKLVIPYLVDVFELAHTPV